MNISKEEALKKIEELKKYVDEVDTKKEEKVVGIAIKNRFTGSIIFQSTKTTFREAVIERLKTNANLSDADLSYADLTNADLSYADLTNANLSDADLSGADLTNADLSYANLSDADLSYADLSGADLTNANLSDADLSGAELQNAKFYGRGGKKELKRSQLPEFLLALGFVIVD